MAWVPSCDANVGKTSKHRRIHVMRPVHKKQTGQPCACRGHPRLDLTAAKTWMASQLGLARVAHFMKYASRLNPACDDKPGHDSPRELKLPRLALLAGRLGGRLLDLFGLLA